MCNNTTPSPFLQTPQLPGTATARPEVTRLLPTMHLRPSVYPSFYLSTLSVSPSVHPSVRSPLRSFPLSSLAQLSPLLSPSPVIHTCVHVVVRNVHLSPRGPAFSSQNEEEKEEEEEEEGYRLIIGRRGSDSF